MSRPPLLASLWAQAEPAPPAASDPARAPAPSPPRRKPRRRPLPEQRRRRLRRLRGAPPRHRQPRPSARRRHLRRRRLRAPLLRAARRHPNSAPGSTSLQQYSTTAGIAGGCASGQGFASQRCHLAGQLRAQRRSAWRPRRVRPLRRWAWGSQSAASSTPSSRSAPGRPTLVQPLGRGTAGLDVGVHAEHRHLPSRRLHAGLRASRLHARNHAATRSWATPWTSISASSSRSRASDRPRRAHPLSSPGAGRRPRRARPVARRRRASPPGRRRGWRARPL